MSPSSSYSRLIAEAGRPDLYVTQEQALILAVEAARRRESADTDAILRAVQDRLGATERVLPVGEDVKVTTLDWSRGAGPKRIIAGGAVTAPEDDDQAPRGGCGPARAPDAEADAGVVRLFDGDSGAALACQSLPHAVEELRFNTAGDRVLAHAGAWKAWSLLGVQGDQLTEIASGETDAAILRAQWSEDGAFGLILDVHGINILNKNGEVQRIPLDSLLLADGQLVGGGQEVLVCGQSAVQKTGFAAVFPIGQAAPTWVIVGDGDPITHCAASARGRWYATSAGEGTSLWDRVGGTERKLGGGEVSVFAFDHAAGEADVYLAAGLSSGAVAMWHVTQEENQCLLNGHEAGVSSLDWSADDRTLLSSSADRTSILWDTALGTKRTALSGHDRPVTEAALDPRDDARVASSSEDGTVRIFRIGQRSPRIFGLGSQDVIDGALSPFEDSFALVRASGEVQIYPTKPEEASVAGEERPRARLRAKEAPIVTARFCGDANTIVTRSADRRVRLYDLKTGALKGTLEGVVLPDALPICSADGRFVAAISAEGAAVWSRATRARVGDAAAVGPLSGVAWNPTQNALALWGGEGTSSVRLMGPGVPADRGPLPGVEGEVHAVAWSHDGRRLAIADDGLGGARAPQLLVYEDVLATPAAAPSRSLDLDRLSRTTDLAWSPDDAHLVSVNTDHGQIWDTRDWRAGARLEAHELRQVVWSPGSTEEGEGSERVATVDAHGVLRLFEPRDGALVALINVPESTIRRVRFTADGRSMLALLSDDTARVLMVYQRDLIAQLCARSVRDLTEDEWARFVVDSAWQATCAAQRGDAGP